ncbi:MAG: hypothetical protein EAX96_00430 [Candidatus Lokiarchaeota archaeon]|nr:hypothetical protein [Candidatus Lokiarchaeota archaeon]
MCSKKVVKQGLNSSSINKNIKNISVEFKMGINKDYADDIAEFLFGQNYKEQYKISTLQLVKDINKYIPYFLKILKELLDFNLIIGFIRGKGSKSSNNLSFSNLRKLIKLNIAIIKRLDAINKGDFTVDD